jgi:hypothetical protein
MSKRKIFVVTLPWLSVCFLPDLSRFFNFTKKLIHLRQVLQIHLQHTKKNRIRLFRPKVVRAYLSAKGRLTSYHFRGSVFVRFFVDGEETGILCKFWRNQTCLGLLLVIVWWGLERSVDFWGLWSGFLWLEVGVLGLYEVNFQNRSLEFLG